MHGLDLGHGAQEAVRPKGTRTRVRDRAEVPRAQGSDQGRWAGHPRPDEPRTLEECGEHATHAGCGRVLTDLALPTRRRGQGPKKGQLPKRGALVECFGLSGRRFLVNLCFSGLSCDDS